MRLVLHYRGPLRSNGDPLHKQQIRSHFSAQLKTLWFQPPLLELHGMYLKPRDPASPGYSFLRQVGGVDFIPLVVAEADTVAELRIMMLRPGPIGAILHQGGDIDNRLKTLFDALSLPQENQVRVSAAAQPFDQPVYCLLEDDRLVTLVEVRAEQLLEPVDPPSTVDLTIAVRTRTTRVTMSNMTFG
jgi:hypothetical protein